MLKNSVLSFGLAEPLSAGTGLTGTLGDQTEKHSWISDCVGSAR
jgi:hypothetical protein